MKLNYEVLWFEDQPDALEHDIQSVRDFLADSGFNLLIDMKSVVSIKDITNIAKIISKYNKYDMIVFDYDMGLSPDGSNIAKKLRAEVFTDMVFYSGKAAADLRRILFENQVDGVFLVDRANFADDLQIILEDHIKKVCDVNGIRGVVMDEMSRFDRMLRCKCNEILEKYSDPQKEAVKNDIVRRVIKSGESKVKSANKISCPMAALADFSATDFNLVRHRLKELTKDNPEVSVLLEDGESLARMQSLRNKLAHLEGAISAEGEMILAGHSGETFDYEKFRVIRKTLREIGFALEAI